MADTGQGLSWSLERACRLRHGDDWRLPHCTQWQLTPISAFASARRENRIVDGIGITGFTIGEAPPGHPELVWGGPDWQMPGVELPSHGFRIDPELDQYGGLPVIEEECGNCEANVASSEASALAGCYGYVEVNPWSRSLDQMLRQRIAERSLERDLTEWFLPTNPVWFGLWHKSPLLRPACEVAHELLKGIVEAEEEQDDDVRRFMGALETAVQNSLPLHVYQHVIGHTDFGCYTVFPHCPRCKADADLPRWQTVYSPEQYECKVCGLWYSPAETASSTQDEPLESDEADTSDLRTMLGGTGWREFVCRYLALRGHSAQTIDEILRTCRRWIGS